MYISARKKGQEYKLGCTVFRLSGKKNEKRQKKKKKALIQQKWGNICEGQNNLSFNTQLL